MEHLSIPIAAVGLIAFPVHASPEDAARERHCIETSARSNHIPAQPLWAIRMQKGSPVGGWHINSNHAVDYGVVQIISRRLPLLAPPGYSAGTLTCESCAAVAAGAWILAQALARYGARNRSAVDGKVYWGAVGDYHPHTAKLNRACAVQVWNRYRQQLATGDLS